MYKILRNVHLAAGLFASVTLAGYGLSALQMAYPFYQPEPQETEWTIEAIPDAVAGNARDLAAWLMAGQHLRGELTETTTGEGTMALTIGRPGTSYRIDYLQQERRAHVTSRVESAIGLLAAIHQTRGLDHDDWVTNAWGGLLLLGAIALVVLASTGLVMWFKRHDDRRMGALLLGMGLVWGATSLVLLRIG